ncbi:MAG: glycosyltransferase [Deltaproteobacteria bacterium]|nr:glycosyltransferase [Deltaproteobacteria bacterium]
MDKGKVVAFVCGSFDTGPVLSYLVQERYKEVVVVALEKDQAEEIGRRGFQCRLLQDYTGVGSEGDLRKQALLWIDSWADRPFAGQQAFKATVTYRNVSLWWFMLPVIFPDLLRCVHYVEKVQTVLAREKPERIVLVDVRGRKNYPFRLYHDENLPGKVIALTCEAEGKVVSYVAPHLLSSVFSAGRRWWVELAGLFYYPVGKWLIGQARRGLTGGWVKKVRKKTSKPVVMVLSSPVYWRDTLDESGRRVRDDAVAGSCIASLAKRGYHITGLDFEINKPNLRQFGVLQQKARHNGIQWRAFECYRPVNSDRSREQRLRLKALGQEIEKSPEFSGSLCYKGVSLGNILCGRFCFMFNRYLNEAVDYLEGIEVAIEHEKPDLLLIVYEEGPYGRAATIVSHWQGLPSLAMQHGVLTGPYLPAYFFKKVSTDVRRDPISCPVPTCTAVYNERTREFLTRVSAYPAESVRVVGVPSYDPILRAKETLDRVAIGARLGLEDGKPLILVLSQPFVKEEDWKFFAGAVLGCARRLPELEWVIKLHPSDLASRWREKANQLGLANLRIISGNLYEWLFVCHIAVSWFSSAILEALVLSRPVIVLRIPGCLNADVFIEDGLVAGVGGMDELMQAINTILSRQAWGDPLTDKKKRALVKHVYEVDGRACERLGNLIDELVTVPAVGDRVTDALDHWGELNCT